MVRCLLLLGEPGIGKSFVLAEHAPLLPAEAGCPVLQVDLSQYGEDRLVREVLDGAEVREWTAGTGEFCLVLDGFDEGLLHIPQLASMLAGRLRSWPCDRLWLRITCRTAQWPALMTSAIELSFPEQHREFELLSLPRADVAALAAQWTDPASFLDAVEASRVVALAGRPLTCRLLAKTHAASGGGLPDSSAALYERGLQALCEESSAKRRAAGQLGQVPASHRLAVASRLAATSVFSGRSLFWRGHLADLVDQDRYSIEELSGGSENADGDAVVVSRDAVREALETALFVGRAPQLLGWAHATFTDFLSARWMINADLTEQQVRALLMADDGRLYPQVRLTAAWLVAIAPDRYQWVALADPEAFSGEVELPGDALRAAVVEGLFTNATRLTRQFGHTYAGLAHPDLPRQIRAGFASPEVDRRRLAVRLAYDCQVDVVREELVRLALNPAEPDDLRVAAGYAVIDIDGDAPSDALAPLVLSEAVRGPDAYDELLGVGLRGSWPHALDSTAVFAVLKRPERRNYHGAYAGFLGHFAGNLPDEALAAALTWLRNQDRGADHGFDVLRDSVLRLAARHLPKTLNDLVKIVLARAVDHLPLYEEDTPAAPDPFDDADRRRTLVEALIGMGPEPGVFYWLTDTRAAAVGPVRPMDLEWIASKCASVQLEARQPWIDLFRLAYRDEDRQHLDFILDMDRAHPLYETVVGEWVRPIDVYSEEAQQMRERWRAMNSSRLPEPNGLDEVDGWIDQQLGQFEAGDLSAYWQAVHYVSVRPGTKKYFDEHIPDLTSLARWKRMPQQTRNRFLAGAPTYLTSRLCSPQDWLGKNMVHYPSRAAYQSLVLLLRLQPEALDSIPPADWQEWAPAIVTWPVTINGAQREDKEALIKHALPHAHTALVTALKVHIEGHLGRDEFPHVVPEIDLLWNADLADHLEQHVRDRTDGAPHYELLMGLVRNDIARARQLLLEWLSNQAIAEQPDRASRAAAILLDHDPETALTTFLVLTRDYPQVAKQAFESRDYIYTRTAPSGSPDQLADLYIWLMRNYPPAEDPDHDDVHVIGPREQIAHGRDAVLDHLMTSGHPDAPAAIRRIATDLASERWLARVEATAQEAVRRARWTPVGVRELRRLAEEATTTLIRSTGELQLLVIGALERIQQRLQGSTPQAHLLWDTVAQRPKDEDDLSDYLEHQLTELIGGQGVVINREVQVRRTGRRGIGERVDIHIAAADPGGGQTMTVVAEVKGAWNPQLHSAMRDQLIDRYLRDVGSSHGIYCVGWFSTTRWEPQLAGLPLDRRHAVVARMDRGQLTHELEQQAEQLRATGFDVKVTVLDVSFVRPGP